MKNNLSITILMLSLAILSSSLAGELIQGPDITAAELAAHLGVFNTSILFKQGDSFSRLTVGLVYKERNSNGTYKETELPCTNYSIPETKEQVIKIFVDKSASTIMVGRWASRGKGVNLSIPSSTMNPPPLLKDGNYALVTLLKDPRGGDSEENIKGILELIVNSGK